MVLRRCSCSQTNRRTKRRNRKTLRRKEEETGGRRGRREVVVVTRADKSMSETVADGRRRRALVSVSEKKGVVELGRRLEKAGWELVSTGGTARALRESGVEVTDVESVTGFPEMLDGRVKTLHPAVHGGILSRRADDAHAAALRENSIAEIDLVAVNLYPFRSTVTRDGGCTFDEGVENIDIGGPAMIRAAAKNHASVFVVVDPEDYDALPIEALGTDGSDTDDVLARLRRRLAYKAFAHVAEYDAIVSEWLWRAVGDDGEPPPSRCVPMRLESALRYGENPHQAAASYSDRSLGEHSLGGVGGAVQHHGKEMSYNNYLDTDAAFSAVCDFAGPACVIVKHTNPCGAAQLPDKLEAYRAAVRADPISAFGGIVAFNFELDEQLAREIREFRSPTDGETRMFYEIVIAPSYTPEGLEVLKGKSKTLRILEAPPRGAGGTVVRQISMGYLVQGADDVRPEDIEFSVVSEAQPTQSQLEDVKMAWRLVKHVKSNAITIVKDGRMLGMGSGQPNRVKSAEIAIEKAGDDVAGSAMASDAFFPFSWNDAVEKACAAGVKVIAHPGGSIRDADAVECCNKYGVVLLTTSFRHFRH